MAASYHLGAAVLSDWRQNGQLAASDSRGNMASGRSAGGRFEEAYAAASNVAYDDDADLRAAMQRAIGRSAGADLLALIDAEGLIDDEGDEDAYEDDEGDDGYCHDGRDSGQYDGECDRF